MKLTLVIRKIISSKRYALPNHLVE